MLMKHYRLRCAQCCVAATLVCLTTGASYASQTVTIGRGDSLDSLARRFHVPVKDIARANGIKDPEAILKDGRKLIIPDAPKSVVRPSTMRKAATVNGDRITIRRGPNEGYSRLILLDHGSQLLITAKAGEWLQVVLPSGSSGWIKNDFVKLGGDLRGFERTAKAEPHRVAKTSKVDKVEQGGKLSKSAKREQLAKAEKRERLAKAAKRERLAKAEKRARVAKAAAKTKHARSEKLASRKSHQKAARLTAHQRRLAAITERKRRERIAHEERARKWALRHSRHTERVASYPARNRPEPKVGEADSDVVRTALAYRGVKYRFGATGNNAFDCSGFTRHVFNEKGVKLPRTAHEQFNKGKHVSSKEMKAGDLVFFHTTRSGISHVGIYAGDGKFVHASSSGGHVRVDRLDSGYYKNRLRGARRLKESKPKPKPEHKSEPKSDPEPAKTETPTSDTTSDSKGDGDGGN